MLVLLQGQLLVRTGLEGVHGIKLEQDQMWERQKFILGIDFVELICDFVVFIRGKKGIMTK